MTSDFLFNNPRCGKKLFVVFSIIYLCLYQCHRKNYTMTSHYYYVYGIRTPLHNLLTLVRMLGLMFETLAAHLVLGPSLGNSVDRIYKEWERMLICLSKLQLSISFFLYSLLNYFLTWNSPPINYIIYVIPLTLLFIAYCDDITVLTWLFLVCWLDEP